MAKTYLTIPEAIDTHNSLYIKAHEADSKAIKGRYICRDTRCSRPVQRIVRNNTCFFRHYSEEGRESHTKSHALHTRAIHEIRNQFENFLTNGLTMPIFLLNTKHGTKEVVPFLFNYHVKTELLLNARKIDVAILDQYNNPLLLIEVLNTHKVSDNKSIDIDLYPWVEIKAQSILNNQRVLKVERHHRFPQEYDNVIQLSFGLDNLVV